MTHNRRYPDGDAYVGISIPDVKAVASRFNIPLRDVEVACLNNGIVPERYIRNLKAFSYADQVKLLTSCVAVVGLGGLGGTVTEILARIGVGELILIDGDAFEEHNLNRQLYSTESTLGAPKADAALQRVHQVNQSVHVRRHPVFVDSANAQDLLKPAQIIVDCLDNLPTRFVVEAAAKQQGCPLVSAAVAGATGHVTIIFPTDTGLASIYGDPAELPPKGAETTLGCLPYAVTTIAALECAQVVKYLLGAGSLLRNKMLMVDLDDERFDTFSFGRMTES